MNVHIKKRLSAGNAAVCELINMVNVDGIAATVDILLGHTKNIGGWIGAD